ncbi:MAG: hypothetical protein EKK41_19600 [Hyphomicrobiales bacterium]|nr:MAG: hypothetical protein EKK41_19600 [Hyphomicrobiales bacterium]
MAHAQSFLVRAGLITAMLCLWPLPSKAATGCAPGTTCIGVTPEGQPSSDPAPSIAQCSGRFPDFIVPASQLNAKGPWFKLAQAYPSVLPVNDATWSAIQFDNGAAGANAYLMALRTYAFEGMIPADFSPQANAVRQWYHMPLMNFGIGPGRRESMRGLTGERSVRGPELGIKPGVTVRNYAVGFYNARGAHTIGQVWKAKNPDLASAKFPVGAMSFKILFSDAKPSDFSGEDLLDGAPQWQISTDAGVVPVRLLQMDVATADDRAPTGWVFGTFAYDKSAPDPSPWLRLRPVGLSWGNDEGYTPADQAAGKPLLQSTISDQIPAFAKNHLGWAGRPNGPVDNPASGCLSCHSTAEYPVVAPMTFTGNPQCNTDQKKLHWFRTFDGTKTFGAIDANCTPITPSGTVFPLDFSLQLKVSVQNVLQYNSVNPCAPAEPVGTISASDLAKDFQDAPRVAR